VTHTVFIDLNSHVVTASATGTAAPDVPLKHLTKQTLAFAFHSGGTVSAVAGWSTGRVVIKATPTSDVLLLDPTLAATGSTTSTRYSAEWAAADCDSAALRMLIGASVEPLDVFAEIQWTADSGTHAVAFPIQIVPTFNLPEDDPPAQIPPAQMDARYVANLHTITGLTGGTATDLDGYTTTDVAAGFTAFILPTIGGVVQPKTFRLIAGTTAENTDPTAGLLVVRPDDYHASTNAKVWVEVG
jgi:hypothetical protein